MITLAKPLSNKPVLNTLQFFFILEDLKIYTTDSFGGEEMLKLNPRQSIIIIIPHNINIGRYRCVLLKSGDLLFRQSTFPFTTSTKI